MTTGGAQPLWHGRFEDGPAAELWAYTVSLGYDRRLAPFDIAGCRAHARGLGRAGLLDEADTTAVLDALDVTDAELDKIATYLGKGK